MRAGVIRPPRIDNGELRNRPLPTRNFGAIEPVQTNRAADAIIRS